MLILGHLQTVKILISHHHATARISTSLRERQQWKLSSFHATCKLNLKGRLQEHSIDFSQKANKAKTAPNFACQFVVLLRGEKCIVIFRKRSTQSEFLDVFYCGHVTYQIWAWFETFKENVNRTSTVNFQCPLDFRSQKKEVLRFP